MKVKTIETLSCDAGWRNYHFVKITTDSGITGWSEYDEGFGAAGLTAAIERMGPRVVGHEVGEHEKIYAELLAQLPAKDAYHAFAYDKHAAADGSSTRDRFQLTNEAVDKLNGAQREFWLGIRDSLGCRELKQAVFRKLAPGLAMRFSLPPEEAAETPAFPLPELFRERVASPEAAEAFAAFVEKRKVDFSRFS